MWIPKPENSMLQDSEVGHRSWCEIQATSAYTATGVLISS